MRRRHRLGEILVNAGLIDEFQLRSALADQQRWGGRLGTALVRLGFLDEEDLLKALAGQVGLPIARLRGKRIAPEVTEILPGSLAEKYGCVPLFTKREGGVDVVYLGMEDPTDLRALDDLTFRTGMKLRPVLVAASELQEAIRTYYGGPTESDDDLGPGFAGLAFDPDDTAPVISNLEECAPAPAPAPEPRRRGPEPALEQAGASASTDGKPTDDKPRDVPTRTILRALTQLLIDKGVVGREELIECVRHAASSNETSDG